MKYQPLNNTYLLTVLFEFLYKNPLYGFISYFMLVPPCWPPWSPARHPNLALSWSNIGKH